MILVSRTLSDGRQLEIRTTPDREVITTIGGVVQSGFSGGMFSAARPFKLRKAVSTSFGLATWAMGPAEGAKLALTDSEAQKILSVIIIQAPAIRTRNPVCGHCGTHCYGDCEASGA